MTLRQCEREPEVLDAVLMGRLPAGLRDHVAECALCREAADIASLVRADFDDARSRASAPTADVVWLRAQIRAREEAARTAARPIVFAQAVAVAALIGVLLSVAGRLSLGVMGWRALLPLSANLPYLPLLPIAAALAAWLVLAPVALYLALSRD